MIAWEESPRQFKMSKQLDEGKFGEDLARKFLNDPIIKVNHGISHYDDVTQDKSYQDKDTDFIVWKKNGKTFGLEAKVDSHNTGNFYLETSVDYFSMVPDALNEQRVARRYRDGIDPLWHTPGWVYRSGADQILYYFRTTQLLYQTKAGKAHDFNRGMKGRTLELLWEKFQNNSFFVYIHMFVTTWHLKYDIIDI